MSKRYYLIILGVISLLGVETIDLKEKKILLVDDEADILHLLEAVLRKENFTKIYKAQNGYEAMEMAQKIKPDIIVLDIMLPDIDGFEVCKRLREITFVPIIFLSARDEDVDKLLGLGIGGDDYITKPFSPREVAFRIKRKIIKLPELARENFAMREKGSGTRELFEKYMQVNGIAIKTAFEGNSPEAIKKEVINNNCLAVISIYLVEAEVKSGHIHVIECADGAWDRYFSIVYHKDKVLTEGMKSLIAVVKDYKNISSQIKTEAASKLVK